MKCLPLLLFLFVLSCTSEKEVLNSWMGSTKHQVILNWGAPSRTASDGNGGEILVWSNQYSYNYQAFWKHTMMYFNQYGKAYHWVVQRNAIPPTQVILK